MTTMERYVICLVKDAGDGRWHLKHGSASLAAFDTKEQAERAGEQHGRLLHEQGQDAEFVVYREDGSIEQHYTYGRDSQRIQG
jgi:hypothetical protein